MCVTAGVVAAVFLTLGSGATAAPSTVPAPTTEDLAWQLKEVAEPEDNPGTSAKVALGKTLFFDPRLSGNGTVSCATCHNPALGWSDGLPTGIGINGSVLARGTPTIVNTGFNTQFMWDGRSRSLEDQALGPMMAPAEMHADIEQLTRALRASTGYSAMFSEAFPGQLIDQTTIAKALAAFQRTVVSRNSAFDRWLAGERDAMTLEQWRGYKVFTDPARGNCAVCHSAPTFTDNGFHNIGIAQAPGREDGGRFNVRALPSMKGAFKTPSLRDVELTAPYLHDGSAATLMDVVEHYVRGGDDKSNLSADIRPLPLTAEEKAELVAFMNALTSPQQPVAIPALPFLATQRVPVQDSTTAVLTETKP